MWRASARSFSRSLAIGLRFSALTSERNRPRPFTALVPPAVGPIPNGNFTTSIRPSSIGSFIAFHVLEDGSVRSLRERQELFARLPALFRAHCFGLASGRIPTPSGASPEHFRRCRLRPPASDFETCAHNPPRRNPLPDPPKILLRRLPSVKPRLGSGDLSLRVARDRWAQKEKT